MMPMNRKYLEATIGEMAIPVLSENVVANDSAKTMIKSPKKTRKSTRTTPRRPKKLSKQTQQKQVIQSPKLENTSNTGRHQNIMINPKTRKPYQRTLSSLDCSENLSAKPQLTALMDQLLVKHRNCCVVRFSESPKSKGYHLSKLLAFEIRKVLRTMAVNLQKIELEFLGIRQTDIVNLVTKVALSANTRNTKCWWPHKTLFSMAGLIQWIQTHYAALVLGGQQHECLDLTFHLYDEARRLHKVNLSIVQVFVNDMEERNKSSLYRFLKSLYGPPNPIRSMLTDFLSEYFTDNGEWLTWLLFDLPIINGVRTISEDMYLMIKAAFVGFESAEEHHSDDPGFNIILPNIKVFSPKTDNAEAGDALALEPFIGGRKNYTEQLRTSTDSNFVEPQDNKKLDHWYSSMDKVFSKLIMAMHVYYDHRFEDTIWEKYMDQDSSEQCGDEVTKLDRSRAGRISSDQLRTYYDQFKAANAAYANLTMEINRSNDSRLLKSFVRAKNQELAEHTANIKLKHEKYSSMRVQRILENAMGVPRETGVPARKHLKRTWNLRTNI